MQRRKTKEIQVGQVRIGHNHPIPIQSMTNTPTEDIAATVEQIYRLTAAGCEIVRCAVPTEEAALALRSIREQIEIPLVADIHFDYRLALRAIESGVDKVRINPGNIGDRERVRKVAEAASAHGIPIRIGVNSGSLEERLRRKYGGVTAEALVESACDQAELLESMGCSDLILSIKASDVPLCVEAYELLASRCSYPLHIGITEAGTVKEGSIKSTAGLSVLLHEGIGDTLRVSLTGDPVEEIVVAKQILRTWGLRQDGVEIISCPTCGRTQIDLLQLAEQVRELTKEIRQPLRIAVMGCVVNGPGEAREADFGVAGGKGEGLLFRRGEILQKVPEEELLSALREELTEWIP